MRTLAFAAALLALAASGCASTGPAGGHGHKHMMMDRCMQHMHAGKAEGGMACRAGPAGAEAAGHDHTAPPKSQ